MSLLDNPKVPSYVVTSALRLLLRIIQNSNDEADAFIKAGGLYSVLQCISSRDAYKYQSSPNVSNDAEVGDSRMTGAISSSQEDTMILTCWVIVSLLLRFSKDVNSDLIDEAILSQKTRKRRIAHVLLKVKSQPSFFSPSKPSLETASTKSFDVGSDVCDLDMCSIEDSNEVYELEQENEMESQPAWKRLNISPSDLATFVKGLCEKLQRNVPQLSTAKSRTKRRRSSLVAVNSDLLLASAGLIAYTAGMYCVARSFE